MVNRGYKPNPILAMHALLKRHHSDLNMIYITNKCKELENRIVYPEHNKEYYNECIKNLQKKGIEI